jgi:lipoprotein NlpI
MSRPGVFGVACLSVLSVLLAARVPAAESDPLSEAAQAALAKQQDEVIARSTEALAKNPQNQDLYSRRGDALFFRGRFDEAVSDYDKMVALDPELETSHWRRGIAYFYAGRYKDAAHQFEIYHSFDQVDRENGIWRFLSQTKAYGIETARAGLLKYKKDDREPFPAVYQLFAGKLTGEQVLEQIAEAQLDPAEREKRLFYAELYIGLDDAVQNKPASARKHLEAAVRNSWGPKAGFGPNYMWHVGRLHYELLRKTAAKP